MVETGKEAMSKQYEMESRVSADRLAYTVAQNNANQAMTTLKQMLQLDPGTDFDILMPDLDNCLLPIMNINLTVFIQLHLRSFPGLKH